MADLAVQAESLIKHSLAENTWNTYKIAVESLNKFRASITYGLLGRYH